MQLHAARFVPYVLSRGSNSFSVFLVLVLSHFADLFALAHILRSAPDTRLGVKLVLAVGRAVVPRVTFIC